MIGLKSCRIGRLATDTALFLFNEVTRRLVRRRPRKNKEDKITINNTKRVIFSAAKTFYNISVMEVYVEYVILDNLIMDYILLKETAVLLKEKFSKPRLIIAAAIGALGAVVFPLLKIKVQYLFLLKIALGALICFIAINFNKVSSYIKFFNVFLLLTFLLGGAVIGAFYLLGINLDDYGSKLGGVLPVGLSVLFGYLLVIVAKRIARNAVNGFITDKYRYKCVIKSGAVAIKADGYFDSGNLLIDKETGLPIALCKKRLLERLKKGTPNLRPIGKMKFSTVGSNGVLHLYPVDGMTVEINGKVKFTNCLLGLVDDDSMNEDLLLGAYLL